MHIFSNTSNEATGRRSDFGEISLPRPSYAPLYPQNNWGGGFQYLPFPQQLLINLIQQLITQLIQALLDQQYNHHTLKPLPLTGDQDDAIRQRFNIGNGDYRILDKDKNQALSAGDQLEIRRGNAIQIIILTEEDVETINSNSFPSVLNLTPEQQAAISARFNHTPPPNVVDGITTEFTGVAIDKDGDGKLSEGDIVKLHKTGGIAGLDQIVNHVLTADDIAAIENPPTNPLLDISNGLSNEQQQRLNEALFGGRVFTSAPTVKSVIDNNGDGKLSVGDTAVIRQFDESTGTTNISFHTITQKDIDNFLNGKNADVQSLLNQNREKWENSGFKQTGYHFRLERSAFAPLSAIRPTINNVAPDGTVDDVFADTFQPVPDDYSQANASIDSLFDIIQNAIDSGADNIQVNYDPISGYPTSIFIDYSTLIADEELSLTISNLAAGNFSASPDSFFDLDSGFNN